MSEKTILELVSRVGSNAYNAVERGDGQIELEVTAAQATKLQALLGIDKAQLSSLKGDHVIILVDRAKLEEKAASAERVSRGSSTIVNITSRVAYAIDAPEATNKVKSAWWETESKTGSIKVNGKEYPIFAGVAADYYETPKDEEEAKEWNPERTVFVVELPTTEGLLTLTSYGVTNLIRRVCGRNEVIG